MLGPIVNDSLEPLLLMEIILTLSDVDRWDFRVCGGIVGEIEEEQWNWI